MRCPAILILVSAGIVLGSRCSTTGQASSVGPDSCRRGGCAESSGDYKKRAVPKHGPYGMPQHQAFAAGHGHNALGPVSKCPTVGTAVCAYPQSERDRLGIKDAVGFSMSVINCKDIFYFLSEVALKTEQRCRTLVDSTA